MAIITACGGTTMKQIDQFVSVTDAKNRLLDLILDEAAHVKDVLAQFAQILFVLRDRGWIEISHLEQFPRGSRKSAVEGSPAGSQEQLAKGRKGNFPGP